MLVVNLCPTDLHFTSSSEQLKFATMVRNIKIDTNSSGRSAATVIEIKNMETKVRTMNTELVETRTRTQLIEQNYEETKRAAQDLVKQLNEHATSIANKYQVHFFDFFDSLFLFVMFFWLTLPSAITFFIEFHVQRI